jgi:hypothetical protein
MHTLPELPMDPWDPRRASPDVARGHRPESRPDLEELHRRWLGLLVAAALAIARAHREQARGPIGPPPYSPRAPRGDLP